MMHDAVIGNIHIKGNEQCIQKIQSELLSFHQKKEMFYVVEYEHWWVNDYHHSDYDLQSQNKTIRGIYDDIQKAIGDVLAIENTESWELVFRDGIVYYSPKDNNLEGEHYIITSYSKNSME